MKDETLNALFAAFCRRQDESLIGPFRDRAEELQIDVGKVVDRMTQILKGKDGWTLIFPRAHGAHLKIQANKFGRRKMQTALRQLRELYTEAVGHLAGQPEGQQ